MGPLQRYPIGSIAPASDTYALVGHYGESTGVAVDCNEGERLPFALAADVPGPLWYIRIADVSASAQAA